MPQNVVFRSYGTTQSLALRQLIRLKRSFEPYQDAKLRTEMDRQKIIAGVKRPRDHVGNVGNYLFHTKECYNFLSQCCENNYEVIFSKLAKTFGLKNASGETPKNAGQVLKEIFLRDNVDLSRFKLKSNEEFRIRRKKRK